MSSGDLRFRDRRIEWWFALQTMIFGVFLSFSTPSMLASGYAQLLVWMQEEEWAVVFLVAGLLHSVALAINGRRWWTPFVRFAATSVNFYLYIFFAAGFLLQKNLTTEIYVYGCSFGSVAMICLVGAAKDSYFALERRRHAKLVS